MSSSADAGYTADEALKIKNTPCTSPKAKKGKHVWKEKGRWPSVASTCKNCGVTKYTK